MNYKDPVRQTTPLQSHSAAGFGKLGGSGKINLDPAPGAIPAPTVHGWLGFADTQYGFEDVHVYAGVPLGGAALRWRFGFAVSFTLTFVLAFLNLSARPISMALFLRAVVSALAAKG